MTQGERSSRLVVIQPIRDWACAECGGIDELLRMDDAGPLCLTCADLNHLLFLPAGDTALTRRATKASSLSAVVVRWSRSRKRYERYGVPARTRSSSPAWRRRSSGYSRDALPRVPPRSPSTPASGAAAGWAGPQQ